MDRAKVKGGEERNNDKEQLQGEKEGRKGEGKEVSMYHISYTIIHIIGILYACIHTH